MLSATVLVFKFPVAEGACIDSPLLYFHEFLYRPKDTEKEKKYEIDFLTVRKKKICPIEVKSSGYKSHKSFDYFAEKYHLKMEERYIIYTKDLKFEEGVTYIPIYMTPFI